MDKSKEAFRTISEVAEWLETPAHVLRFWESRFTQIKPVKRAGGRRYYRPADMRLLGGIKKLLHENGMTIRGVQKLLREEGVKYVSALSTALEPELEEASDFVPEAPMAEDVQPDPVVDNVVMMQRPAQDNQLATEPGQQSPGDSNPASEISTETEESEADAASLSYVPGKATGIPPVSDINLEPVDPGVQAKFGAPPVPDAEIAAEFDGTAPEDAAPADDFAGDPAADSAAWAADDAPEQSNMDLAPAPSSPPNETTEKPAAQSVDASLPDTADEAVVAETGVPAPEPEVPLFDAAGIADIAPGAAEVGSPAAVEAQETRDVPSEPPLLPEAETDAGDGTSVPAPDVAISETDSAEDRVADSSPGLKGFAAFDIDVDADAVPAGIPTLSAPDIAETALDLPEAELAPPEGPVVLEPVAETPDIEAPVVDMPAVQAPVAESAVTEEPVAGAPTVEAPTVEAPAFEAPAADADFSAPDGLIPASVPEQAATVIAPPAPAKPPATAAAAEPAARGDQPHLVLATSAGDPDQDDPLDDDPGFATENAVLASLRRKPDLSASRQQVSEIYNRLRTLRQRL
jgi:resuscitation-promoting factor RpfA